MSDPKLKQLVKHLEQHPDLPTDGKALVEYLDKIMGPKIGRPARPITSQDLEPVINKTPTCYAERQLAFEAKKRAGYQLEVSEQLEFMDFAGDDSGYVLNDDGEYGYDDSHYDAADAIINDNSGFGNQW